MNLLAAVYKPALGLLTDLYELTMAYGYWKTGIQDRPAVFHLFFREHPFGGGFTVAAGLATAVEFLEILRFDRGRFGLPGGSPRQRRRAAVRAGVSRLPRPASA